MELKLFHYIDEVLAELEDMREELEEISTEIELFFEKLLFTAEKGFVNMNTRVKSKKSLKEKIIRNDYYQKYTTIETVLENLPDLIGIRIECRFNQDEAELYKFIKKQFSEKSEELEDYYFSLENPDILLNLGSKQPKEQKNGIKMYRIDGKYIKEHAIINFELQIKSLVNVFWSEIEHKIIYKNYNYVIADRFYKDIMKSIKNSLATIDQQLLLISNQFEKQDTTQFEEREEQLEKLISKIIYDVFAGHMKESIGVLVDFRKSCEAIVKYVLRDTHKEGIDKYSGNLLLGLERIKQIEQKNIDFKKQIIFEREPVFKNELSKIIGSHIKNNMNEEFQWSVFFTVLFQIEPSDNVGDFETFVHYYTDNLIDRITVNKISSNFTQEETSEMIKTLMLRYAQIFVQINSVQLLYENNVEQVLKIINSIIDTMYRNIITFEQWEREKSIYIELLELRLLSLFDVEISPDKVLDFLEHVRRSHSTIDIPKGLLKYIYKIP
ncbi:(p)ppGpp synthetase [Sporanaerobium hydrogeniformans]|uniref:(P)ppGpp synthetase n=1 Tax=Sporanaerobium hydrogeniformans TaxID=3072179 RepID=A0AC61DA33_9FIRM|nr:(p)ppGpp synthetase [Sporanaerobium hydrogeniformans]PHV70209.1 (p)ppGpp synthetase [Sporanaerobium hydrogeniformans]